MGPLGSFREGDNSVKVHSTHCWWKSLSSGVFALLLPRVNKVTQPGEGMCLCVRVCVLSNDWRNDRVFALWTAFPSATTNEPQQCGRKCFCDGMCVCVCVCVCDERKRVSVYLESCDMNVCV